MNEEFRKKIIALRGELGKKWPKDYGDKFSDIYRQHAEILNEIKF